MYNEHQLTAELSLADYVKIAKRWWWMFVPIVALAIGIAAFYTAQTPRIYSAEAEVAIRTEESANLFPLSDAGALLRSPSAEAGFLESTEFEIAATEAADSDGTVTVDVGDVNSRVEPSFISFRSRASSPEAAANVAQAWAQTYIDLRHERDETEIRQTIDTLQARIDQLEIERQEALSAVAPLDAALQRATDSAEIAQLTTQRVVILQALESTLQPLDSQVEVVAEELADLQLVEDFFASADLSARINRTAEVPAGPVSPSLPRNLALAIVAGAVLAAAAILLAETLDDRARSVEMVRRRLGLNALTTIPHRRKDDEGFATIAGPVAESFHRLASAIDFVELSGAKSKVLMFTSANASEAKTSTVTRLGATLARQGRRTLVIGADLRRPTLASRLGVGTGAGLGEVLGGLYPFESCVLNVPGHEGLQVLRAGTVATEGSPVDLLRTDSLQQLIDQLRGEYDHILIDCPPVLPVVDALEVSRVCDGIIFNLFAGNTRLARAERAVEMIMQASRVPVLGFVMTGLRARDDAYRSGDYYYTAGAKKVSHEVRNDVVVVDSQPVVMPEVQITEVSLKGDDQVRSTSIDDVTFHVDGSEREVVDLATLSTGKETK